MKRRLPLLPNCCPLTDEELGEIESNRNNSPRYDPTLLKEDIPLQEVALGRSPSARATGRHHPIRTSAILSIRKLRFPCAWLCRKDHGRADGKAPFEDAGRNDYVGQSGVELIYDKILFGRNGVQRVVVNSSRSSRENAGRCPSALGRDGISCLWISMCSARWRMPSVKKPERRS